VVSAAEVNHLEGEGLPPEVCRPVKLDRQVNLDDELRPLPWYDPVEGRSSRMQSSAWDSHGHERFSVEDVAASPSVHQDLLGCLVPMIGSTTRGYLPSCGT
jgi:hypothetical protein